MGFLFTVANFVLLSFYDYSYYASSVDIPPETGPYPPVPNWVWIVCALNHFLAHTLGKFMEDLSGSFSGDFVLENDYR